MPAAVLVGVEARFQETQRERRAIQHLGTSGRSRPRVWRAARLALTSPISSASSAEYILQRNHISGLLRPDQAGEDRRAESAVETADLWADLPELRVVGGDGEVAHHMQDVPPADGVSCHHRDDGLGQRRIWTCRSVT